MHEICDRTNKQFVFLQGWTPPPNAPRNSSPTLAEMRALNYVLVPRSCPQDHRKYFSDLDKACGGLQMLWSSYTPIIQDFFENKMTSIRKEMKTDLPRSFGKLFVITQLMEEIDNWYTDIEETEGVTHVMNKLHKLWQDMFAKTNDEIGLAGNTDPRKQIGEWLRRFSNNVKEASEAKFKKFDFQ